jgi:hypothetical protein
MRSKRGFLFAFGVSMACDVNATRGECQRNATKLGSNPSSPALHWTHLDRVTPQDKHLRQTAESAHISSLTKGWITSETTAAIRSLLPAPAWPRAPASFQDHGIYPPEVGTDAQLAALGIQVPKTESISGLPPTISDMGRSFISNAVRVSAVRTNTPTLRAAGAIAVCLAPVGHLSEQLQGGVSSQLASRSDREFAQDDEPTLTFRLLAEGDFLPPVQRFIETACGNERLAGAEEKTTGGHAERP